MSESIEELEGDADFLDDMREWSVLFDSDQICKSQQSLPATKYQQHDNEKKKKLKQNKNDKSEQSSAVTLKTAVDAKNGTKDVQKNIVTPDHVRSTNISKNSSSKTNLFEEITQDLKAAGAQNEKNLSQSMTACSPKIIAGKKHKLLSNEPDNAKLKKTDMAKTVDKARTKVSSALQSEDTKEKEIAKNAGEDNSLEQISQVKKDEITLIKNKNDNKSSSELPKMPMISEVECRNIDNLLVEEMMEELKQQLISHQGDKYIIRFSPVELADLADTSVQDLIHSQPNLTFYFKRQGKFKKKKGYAESYFYQSQEVQSFLQKFLLLKLVENKVDVTITYLHGSKEPELLSFSALLDKNSQLIKLVKSLEDSAKSKIDTKEFFEVENVPFGATALMLKTLFPFSKSIQLPSDKSVNKDQCFKGTTKVFLTNESWIEAVTSCCSDFKYKSKPLTVLYKSKEMIDSRNKTEPDVKKETVFENKKESVHDSKKDVHISNISDKMNSDNKNQQINVLSPSFPVESPQAIDADISSMTLDVCTGMLESLNKLKKLGTDNPNVLKILEMQSEIASLQQSLSQSVKTSPADISDPWSVGPSDKLSKKDRKKIDDEKRWMKQIKEMEDLQKMIEDADEIERQKEESVRRQREQEQQKMKLTDEKSKLSWARKMIEEAKLTGGSLSGESSATKQEAQRMLRAREERLKEEEEAKKREDLKKKSTPESVVQETKAAANDSSAVAKDQEAQILKDAEEVIPSKTDSKDATKSTKVEDKDPEVSTSTGSTKSARPTQDKENTIYSESDYNQMVASNTLHLLPSNYFIQLSYFNNRQCPVRGCPATKFFKTAPSFIDHWEIFHRPNVTMRFCSKCSAYFMNTPELESHLLKRHSVTDAKVVSKLVQEARVKIVSNPSYRDPGQYLAPVI